MRRKDYSISRMSISAALSLAMVALLCGCSSAWQSTASVDDGMYGTHNRTQIANRQRAEAEARRAEAEARRAELEARIAEAEVAAIENGYYSSSSSSNGYSSVLADSYESAYARRLQGFTSPTYRMPSSYYNLRYSTSFNYVTAYDPAFYNIMVSGNQVWVEPKYISSMFGTWGATNVTLGISISPYGWYYGWSRPYYSSWWGYPRYSWYDWNWGVCYNPGHWWNYGWGWAPSWGAGGYYGWNHGWGIGGSRPPRPSAPPAPAPRPQRPNITNGGRPATQYQSPSSGKNYGNGGVGNGVNRGTVNGSGTFNQNNRNNGSQNGRTGTGSSSGSGAVRSRTNSGSSGSSTGSSTNTNKNNTQRSGSSSFFNNNNSSGSSSRSSSGSSYSGGSSSGGSRSGGSTGSSNRGNSLGR